MNRPTSKLTLILILIATLAIIGAIFLAHHGSRNVKPAIVTEDVPLPGAASWPSTKVRDEVIADNASYYTISATYPVTKDEVINGYFKSFVDQNITQFKDDTSWAAGNGANAAPAEAGTLSLSIKYREEKNSRADNYVFSVDTYTGGAHGLQSTAAFVFSPTGQRISLQALFANGNDGLKTLSPYVKAQLQKALPPADQQFVDDGTAPTAANYAVFIVQENGMTFIFDPYQVAPYSDGQQKVFVPLSVFKSVASADFFGK